MKYNSDNTHNTWKNVVSLIGNLIPDVKVFRSYLRYKDVTSSGIITDKITCEVILDSIRYDPYNREQLKKYTTFTVVLRSNVDALLDGFNSMNALISILDKLNLAFNQSITYDTKTGEKLTLYLQEAQHDNNAPLYDLEAIMDGEFIGVLNIATEEFVDKFSDEELKEIIK